MAERADSVCVSPALCGGVPAMLGEPAHPATHHGSKHQRGALPSRLHIAACSSPIIRWHPSSSGSLDSVAHGLGHSWLACDGRTGSENSGNGLICCVELALVCDRHCTSQNSAEWLVSHRAGQRAGEDDEQGTPG
jgi:hypothetical protein